MTGSGICSPSSAISLPEIAQGSSSPSLQAGGGAPCLSAPIFLSSSPLRHRFQPTRCRGPAQPPGLRPSSSLFVRLRPFRPFRPLSSFRRKFALQNSPPAPLPPFIILHSAFFILPSAFRLCHFLHGHFQPIAVKRVAQNPLPRTLPRPLRKQFLSNSH
jgi:hypothetical protein